jgi:hypothetical protein
MSERLSPDQEAQILPHINNVLKHGGEWEDEDLHFPVGPLIDSILSIKGVALTDNSESQNGRGFNSNGWSWDWWQDFTYKGQHYTLSGSGWYGGHHFGLQDED